MARRKRKHARGDNRALAAAAAAELKQIRPATLRQLFYRLVSAGHLPSTAHEHYARLVRLMTKLRESGAIPMAWLVDNLRTTLKPNSWTDPSDFREDVIRWYRKDLWVNQAFHVEILCEKDAVAGTLEPVTDRYDVALRVCRGYGSVSFKSEIANELRSVEKPIMVYYLGDHDPSGFDIERDMQEKLRRYGADFTWKRLAVTAEDFAAFNLLPLPVKKSDCRAGKFEQTHGQKCAEVDALPPTELRRRVEDAILLHIDMNAWMHLEDIERQERETLRRTLAELDGAGDAA